MVNLKLAILVFFVVLNLSTIECGRGGGGRGFGGGGRSFSRGSGGFSIFSGKSRSSSSSTSSGSKWNIFGKGSSSSSNSGSSSINKGTPLMGSAHATSHILPLSTGNRNTQNQYVASAPALPTGQSGAGSYNLHSPSAPPLLTGNSKQPPGPGWNVPINNQPPSYPGMKNHPPQGPPPPYTGHSSYNGPPPPYSGAPPAYSASGSMYNHGQLPPAYPGISRAPAPSMGGSAYYASQQGGPVYQPRQQYYPPANNLPPPPPGYSPYGVPYYQKTSSGISSSDVMMGLAFWQLSRSNSHHHHFHHYDDSNYHGYNRNHYTTTYHSPNSNSNAPGNQNTLEMTHFIVPDEKGEYTTVVGNQTCVSVYNAKAVNKWATQQMDDFKKKFPNTTFPLFSTGNETFKNDNFTMIPGRVIHIEPISITCCGTHKKPLELTKLTDGKSANVNCVHLTGQIPLKKMNFIKIEYINTPNQNMSDWFPLQLVEPDFNSTTPKYVNVTSSTPLSIDETQTFTSLGRNSSTTTPLSIDETQTFTALGVNQTTTSTASPSSATTTTSTTTTESVDSSQTFKPLGVNTSTTTETVKADESQTFSSVTTQKNAVVAQKHQ